MELGTQSIKLLDFAAQTAKEYYDFEGEIKQLAGEFDFNFYLKAKDEREYILKIAAIDADFENIQLQQAIIQHLTHKDLSFDLPEVVDSKLGNEVEKIEDFNRDSRFVRMLTWVPGRLYADINYYPYELHESLGRSCAELDLALLDFDHPGAHRQFKWNNSNALWVKEHLQIFQSPEKTNLIRHFVAYFEEQVLPELDSLRKSVIYNDANDYNLLVSQDLKNPRISGFIDFGDAVYSHTINELAIAIAYAAMAKHDPLAVAKEIVGAYHKVFSLKEAELAVLYGLVAARLFISLTVSTLNAIERPDNKYLLVSQKYAWDLLEKWQQIAPQFAHYSFRGCLWISGLPQSK